MKIKVLGWTGKGNTGDEAYKLAFPTLFPEFDFNFGLENGEEVCFLGGGDILNKSFVQAALKYSKRYAISVTVKPDSPFELLREFDGIYVRDAMSSQILRQNEIPHFVMPDIASCLAPDFKNFHRGTPDWISEQFKQKGGADLYEKKVGVVLNAHLFHGKEVLARDYLNLQKVMFDLSRLADETSASFIFFPMSTSMPWDDRVTNSSVAARCKYWNKNLMIYDELGVIETINLIASCDVLISTRLHSTIFAIMNSVPFVDLVHHDKNRGYLQSVGLLDWAISYWEFDYNELKSQVKSKLLEPKPYTYVLLAEAQANSLLFARDLVVKELTLPTI